MGTDDVTAFNHVGHCVTDLDRARRFYEEALGFRYLYEIKPPDDPSSRLLMIEPPVGSTAVVPPPRRAAPRAHPLRPPGQPAERLSG